MREQRPDDSQDLVTLMLVPGRSGNIRRFNVRRRLLRNYAVGAVLTTAQDVVLTLGILSLLQIPLDLPIVVVAVAGIVAHDVVRRSPINGV